MPRSVLVVSNNEDTLRFTRMVTEPSQYTVTCAMLSEDKASDTYPYIGDILRQCRDTGTQYDAIMIYDPSKPKNGAGLEFLHNAWVQAGNQLKTVERDMEAQRIHVDYTTNDDASAVSARYEDLMRSFDAMHQAQVNERRDHIRRTRDAVESLMLTNPPSSKGIDLLRALRSPDSPYCNTPIAISGAFPDREKELLAAGATIVHTSADTIMLTPEDILDIAFDKQEGVNANTVGKRYTGEDAFRKRLFAERVLGSQPNCQLRRYG